MATSMVAAPSLSTTRLTLGLLRELKVAEPDVGKVRDELDKANQLAIDDFGYVQVSDLRAAAKRVGVELPEATLGRLFAPISAAPAMTVSSKPGDFPEVKVSASEARTSEARAKDAKIGAAELGGLAAPLQRFLEGLGGELGAIDLAKGVGARQLAEALDGRRASARNHLTPDQIEAALKIACSAVAPGHVERDAFIDLDSKLALLGQAKTPAGDVRIYKKSMLEHLFLRRGKDKTFELHGFTGERVVVTVPPKGSVLILDAKGDQRGILRPEPMTIDGATASAVELSRSLVQSSGTDPWRPTPAFTVRVLDADKNVVHEQKLTFGADPGMTSKKLLEGRLGYGARPEGTTNLELAYAVPNAKTNSAPVGERPRFDLAGAEGCDQLLIRRDGKTFAVNRLVQLLDPPRATAQALKHGGLTYELRPPRSRAGIDAPDYDPTGRGKVALSNGHVATFDRSLGITHHARWTSAGLEIFEPDGSKAKATLDPLA